MSPVIVRGSRQLRGVVSWFQCGDDVVVMSSVWCRFRCSVDGESAAAALSGPLLSPLQSVAQAGLAGHGFLNRSPSVSPVALLAACCPALRGSPASTKQANLAAAVVKVKTAD